MTGTAMVARETGEVMEVKHFDVGSYLDSISTPAALAIQQRMAGAYDAACRALIGPNDVQKESGREFKKKSAWRKLQRHFNISTEVRTVHKEWSRVTIGAVEGNDVFVATVTVRAVAPWGQSAEAVGACGQDEESGRRKITIADAIATAETRATNRAVSNLIAMGEVSAEEIGDRAPMGSRAPKADADKVMPIGKQKGKALGSVATEDLEGTREWCREKGAEKWASLISSITTVLEGRRNADATETAQPLSETPVGLAEENDDLPF